MRIGANIQATRQAAGLTQEQLAAKVGVSRQTVAKWESGETPPDLEHAAALADALIDQEAMLRQVACPVVYLKATTRHGDDGMLYAATTDDDAARVREYLADCEYAEIDSGHDIHVERPGDFVEAVGRVV